MRDKECCSGYRLGTSLAELMSWCMPSCSFPFTAVVDIKDGMPKHVSQTAQ